MEGGSLRLSICVYSVFMKTGCPWRDYRAQTTVQLSYDNGSLMKEFVTKSRIRAGDCVQSLMDNDYINHANMKPLLKTPK
ncbi:hypothetical protein U0070_020793 [Myodes glareolus]|uniref:Uncharacterized protein n=1 Tax=Myodes glareolus TaxID=447135 RepID=A0AAW0IDU8_MYOGA